MNLTQIKKHITISEGNIKVGRVSSISLPPVVTCNPKAPCTKGSCYVLHTYNIRPSVRKAYQKNLNTFNSDPTEYFNLIKDWLTIKNPKLFRYHVSGDIPNKVYLDGMRWIAVLFPNIKFLAFTKQYKLNRYFKDLPINLSIIISAWPGMRLPKTRLSIAFMQDGNESRVNNAIECFGNCEACGMCWSLKDIGKNVVFNKH